MTIKLKNNHTEHSEEKTSFHQVSLFKFLPLNWVHKAPGQVKAALAALDHEMELDHAQEMANLEGERDQLKAQYGVTSTQLAKEEKSLEKDRLELPQKPGNPVQLISWVLALGIALFAEYSLTVTTIPFLTGVSEFELRGIVLGLAPVAAFLVLEITLDYLVESPNRWVNSKASAGHRGRGLARAWVLSFYLAVVVMNVECLRALANAREFILTLKQTMEMGQVAMANFEPTPEYYHAILMLTLTLAVNGSIFALRSSVEFQALSVVATFDKREKNLNKAQRELADLESRLETAQRCVDEGTLPSLTAKRKREEKRAEIHQNWQATAPDMSAQERVEQMCADLQVEDLAGPAIRPLSPRIA